MRRRTMALVLILIIWRGGSVYASDYFTLEEIRGNGGYEFCDKVDKAH